MAAESAGPSPQFDGFLFWRPPLAEVAGALAEELELEVKVEELEVTAEELEVTAEELGVSGEESEVTAEELGTFQLVTAVSAFLTCTSSFPAGPLARALGQLAGLARGAGATFLAQGVEGGVARLDLVVGEEARARRLQAALEEAVPRGVEVATLLMTPGDLGHHLPPALTEGDLLHLLASREANLPPTIATLGGQVTITFPTVIALNIFLYTLDKSGGRPPTGSE